LCHGEVLDAAGEVIDRSRHGDGHVDLAFPKTCDGCHGSGPMGAPPPGLGGSSAAVGAHATHLAGTERSRAVLCSECHVVPKAVGDPGHLDAVPPNDVTFSGVALAFGAKPSFDGKTCKNSYCHNLGNLPSGGDITTLAWSAPGTQQVYCGSCHSLPPPAPHPNNPSCWTCHPNVTPTYQFVDPSRHVNGHVDFD